MSVDADESAADLANERIATEEWWRQELELDGPGWEMAGGYPAKSVPAFLAKLITEGHQALLDLNTTNLNPDTSAAYSIVRAILNMEQNAYMKAYLMIDSSGD